MDFAHKRYNQLVEILSRIYSKNADAAIYSPEYRIVLAKCMAAYLVYGVQYDDEVMLILKRINQSSAAEKL